MNKISNLFCYVILVLVFNLNNDFILAQTCGIEPNGQCEGTCPVGQECLYWNSVCGCVRPCGVYDGSTAGTKICSGGCKSSTEICGSDITNPSSSCVCQPPGCSSIKTGINPNTYICTYTGCPNLGTICGSKGFNKCECGVSCTDTTDKSTPCSQRVCKNPDKVSNTDVCSGDPNTGCICATPTPTPSTTQPATGGLPPGAPTVPGGGTVPTTSCPASSQDSRCCKVTADGTCPGNTTGNTCPLSGTCTIAIGGDCKCP